MIKTKLIKKEITKSVVIINCNPFVNVTLSCVFEVEGSEDFDDGIRRAEARAVMRHSFDEDCEEVCEQLNVFVPDGLDYSSVLKENITELFFEEKNNFDDAGFLIQYFEKKLSEILAGKVPYKMEVKPRVKLPQNYAVFDLEEVLKLL